VIVIGGGISGLACALRLRQTGVDVTLLEGAEKPGGLIGTERIHGFLFESGPQSFQGTEALLELVRALGLGEELCKADPRAPRFVLRHGRMEKIPMSPGAMLGGSLLGVGSRWKIVSEPFRRAQPSTEDESVASFVRRRFGDEILDYLVAPFVSGVYAGDPETLSLRSAFPSLDEWERKYGSVVRGAMKARSTPAPLCSFRGGMGALLGALGDALGARARFKTLAQAVRRIDAGGRARYEVSTLTDGRADICSAEAVVLATPAFVASQLIASVSPELARTLSGIAYAGVAVVAAGYYANQLRTALDGFGVLIPRVEGHRTLGIVWNSSLFAGRAPQGQVTITSFGGGATDPGLLEASEETITAIVEHENSIILGVLGQPIEVRVWKHPKALPQYNLGHSHIVETIRDQEKKIPGLYVAGNYLAGPSIGACFEQGSQTAEAVRVYAAALS
jgi:protoporphyrinogen/coproporphyrinogen III oxidase